MTDKPVLEPWISGLGKENIDPKWFVMLRKLGLSILEHSLRTLTSDVKWTWRLSETLTAFQIRFITQK